jgi:NAD(P)-dependent dehydrogenase (short-subunit alcohol dehydrogenase family)
MAYQGFDLSGKVALVTGGTGGLGRAMAVGLAQAGAQVVVGARTESQIVETVQELRRAGAETGMGLRLDVSDPTSVRETVDRIVAQHDRLDILVNAAGTHLKVPSMEMGLEEYERVLRVNLTGTFLCCQSAGRVMQRLGGGAIINIASIASFVALADAMAYGISKAGVALMTKSLANDWARYGIRVNAIAPGVVPTSLNRQIIEGTERGAAFLRNTPMERFGSPEEVAGAVIYLASPAARYVTGEILVVDGGFLARGI